MKNFKHIMQAGVSAAVLAAMASPVAGRAAESDPNENEGQADVQSVDEIQADDAQSVDEIIVTAQKRSERLRDVPMSISAASAEQLQSRGISDTEQLGKLVPGFSAQKTHFGLPVYFIRGVGFYDTTLGVSPAVTVYTDQIPLPFSPMARGAVLDLERIEILKGPQGTLFGQNSTGGAINYIAAKPTNQLAAGFKLDIGRFKAVNAEAFVSGPISDTLSARLAIRQEYQDDWQRNFVNGETLGEKRFVNGRLLLDWKPMDRARFELQVTGWKDTSDAQQPQFRGFSPQTPEAVGGRPQQFPIATAPIAPENARAAAWDPGQSFARDDRFYQFGLRGDIDLSDAVTLTSITSYIDYRTSVPQDLDATIYPIDRIDTTGQIKTFSQELRLAGSAKPGVQWMAGASYQHDDVKEQWLASPVRDTNQHIGPLNWDSFLIRNDQKIKTASVFGSLGIDLTDTLTAQASVRYTDQNRSFEGCSADDGSGQIAAAFSFLSQILTGNPVVIPPGSCITLAANGAPLSEVTGKLNENNLSWRAGLSWKPTDQAMIYANVTKGYKAGSFPTLAAAVENQLVPIPQESVLAYEIGAKFEMFDRNLTVDTAAFYYDYQDKQLIGYRLIPPFGPLQSMVSIPKSKIQGVELNVVATPVTGLRLSVGGTYVKSEVRRDPSIPTGPFGNVGGTFVGQAFPFTPKWQGVADAEYRFPVSSRGDVYLGASATARSSTTGALLSGLPAAQAQEQNLEVDGYALLDLRAGFETSDKALRFELWGRNVTNKYYAINNQRAADFLLRFAGMPATYGVTLSYRFGD